MLNNDNNMSPGYIPAMLQNILQNITSQSYRLFFFNYTEKIKELKNI